jgi:hypothetical protein
MSAGKRKPAPLVRGSGPDDTRVGTLERSDGSLRLEEEACNEKEAWG